MNLRTPDLIHPFHANISQQVGINLVDSSEESVGQFWLRQLPK